MDADLVAHVALTVPGHGRRHDGGHRAGWGD